MNWKCLVFGHDWSFFPRTHPRGHMRRKCQTCGKYDYFQWGKWKPLRETNL